MLSVYGLTCAGLRDPVGVSDVPVLRWRLGSDVPGVCQRAARVAITCADDGVLAYDSHWCASDTQMLLPADLKLVPGATYVWFVEVRDTEGVSACSAPAAFRAGVPGDVPKSMGSPERLACVWTSDSALDASLEEEGRDQMLDDVVWRHVLGLRAEPSQVEGCGHRACLRIAPEPDHPLAQGLTFAQGSLLLPNGLLIVRWERGSRGLHLRVSMPPGAWVQVGKGANSRPMGPGVHELALD